MPGSNVRQKLLVYENIVVYNDAITQSQIFQQDGSVVNENAVAPLDADRLQLAVFLLQHETHLIGMDPANRTADRFLFLNLLLHLRRLGQEHK